MSERREIVALVREACGNGACFEGACAELDISPRTVQRWMRGGDDLKDDGRKNNSCPISNALSPEERNRVAEIACSPEFRDKSPNQIVPKLAERGVYVASERTFYRILRAMGLPSRPCQGAGT